MKHISEQFEFNFDYKFLPKLEKIPDYGYLVPIEEFNHDFSDSDGLGNFATLNGISNIQATQQEVALGFKPEWATHVMWFSK